MQGAPPRSRSHSGHVPQPSGTWVPSFRGRHYPPPVASPEDLARAALQTADLLRRAAEIARQQSLLASQRAELTRAVARSEEAEAALMTDPNHAAPREQRVKLLQDEARVLDLEAQTLDKESERMLSQARTAEQRAKLAG